MLGLVGYFRTIWRPNLTNTEQCRRSSSVSSVSVARSEAPRPSPSASTRIASTQGKPWLRSISRKVSFSPKSYSLTYDLPYYPDVFHGFVFSLFFTHWLESDGGKKVFLAVGGIQLACLLSSIPMYIYGKRARMWTVRKNMMEKF